MHARRFALKSAGACALAILLAGCSSEPSASDITDALNRAIATEMKQLNQITSAFGGTGVKNPMSGMMPTEVTDLEKISCQESGKKAFVCNVRYTMVGGMFGKAGQTMAVPLRVMQTDDGWMASAR